jgi:CubicO group peptidase (beta-lactamase class C family)
MTSLEQKVDALFERWNRPDSPGCAVGIISDGELVYERYFGAASLEFGVPIGRQTRFQIASMSKQFTAAGIHLLALRGRLSVDDEIQKHLPDFPRYAWPIAVRHLLHHTSGLREEGLLHWFRGGVLEGMDNASLCRLIARQKSLNYPPGAAHAYCNSGYTLLAEIIQRVSGQSLRDFTREHIFGPLGMSDSLFDDDCAAVVPHRAESYGPRPGGFAHQHKTYNAVGAGGMLSTLRDFAQWDRNFYAPAVGGPELIARMLERGRLNDGHEITYASALSHAQYRGLPIVRHGGMILGFRSQLIRFPEQRFSAIILANVNPFNPTRLIEQIADIYLAEHFTEPPVTLDMQRPPDESALAEQVGMYFDSESGAMSRLSVRQGLLFVEALGAVVPVAPIAGRATRYRSLDGPPLTIEVELKRSAPGGPYQIRLQAEMHTLPVMTHVAPVERPAPELQACVGDYYSDELEARWRFEFADDKLRGGLPSNGPYGELRPGPEGVLFLNGLVLTFEHDASGAATGFILTDPRARRIRFVRQ